MTRSAWLKGKTMSTEPIVFKDGDGVWVYKCPLCHSFLRGDHPATSGGYKRHSGALYAWNRHRWTRSHIRKSGDL